MFRGVKMEELRRRARGQRLAWVAAADVGSCGGGYVLALARGLGRFLGHALLDVVHCGR